MMIILRKTKIGEYFFSVFKYGFSVSSLLIPLASLHSLLPQSMFYSVVLFIPCPHFTFQKVSSPIFLSFILLPTLWERECYQGKHTSILKGIVSLMDDHGGDDKIEEEEHKWMYFSIFSFSFRFYRLRYSCFICMFYFLSPYSSRSSPSSLSDTLKTFFANISIFYPSSRLLRMRMLSRKINLNFERYCFFNGL